MSTYNEINPGGCVRLQCKNKVIVRQSVIGGRKVMICLPLMAETKTGLRLQAQEATSMKPDLVEWRVDAYEGVESTASSLEALEDLRRQIGAIPLIFTFRIHSQGGVNKIAQADRLDLIKTAIQSGHVDIVDVEMCNEPAFIEAVRTQSKDSGAKVIFSYHDFQSTPEEDFIYDKLKQAQTMGADIAKLAVMPNGYDDVLRLLNATLRARTQGVQIPMVTMAMGDQGGITRIAGGLFGSDITFATGKEASAPGQIPIDRLRGAMDVVYGS